MKSSKYLTKYEQARVLGLRATQISAGAKVEIDTNGEIDPLRIALIEFRTRKIPFIIKRTMPDGSVEEVKLKDLIY